MIGWAKANPILAAYGAWLALLTAVIVAGWLT